MSAPERYLALLLVQVMENDKNYSLRDLYLLAAVDVALECGYRAGFAWDDNPDALDNFRLLAYIDLPTGQCAWHRPNGAWTADQLPKPYYTAPRDGHTTEEKYERIRAYVEQVRRGR